MKTRKKLEVPIQCLTCGFDGKHLVHVGENDRLPDVCRCPKCSKTAYVLSLSGAMHLCRAMAKEIVAINSRIFDLEAADDKEDR